MAKFNSTTINGTLLINGLVSGFGTKLNPVILTSGSGTYSPSSTDVIGAIVIVTGAGGSGGNAYVTDSTASAGGSGGAAGGTGIRYYNYQQLNGATYTVGAGGTPPGGNGATGGAGGSSSFVPTSGVTITANGGNGGGGSGTAISTVNVVAAPNGGTSTGGQINIQGGKASFGYSSQATNGLLAVGGIGGTSFWSNSVWDNVLTSTGVSSGSSQVEISYGCGGSGGAVINTATTNAPGAPGGNGVIVVLELI